jgi:acetolactate synthase-1/2/3 large subunit
VPACVPRPAPEEAYLQGRPVYQIAAEAFAAEGVETYFTLMGDANMHWSTALSALPGVTAVHVRHEHAAVAMAMGYHGATGKIGIASVTCGPGFTQVMTALAGASHNNVPLVLFAGEPPQSANWYLQAIDQRALALPTGAHYIAIHSASRAQDGIREAFYVARTQQRPVVVAIPYDLQKEIPPDPGPYRTSDSIVPVAGKPLPDAAQTAELARMLLAAERPILVAGRGVLQARCEELVEHLAERTGALLATTLRARGLFDGNPFGIGIAGGYARPVGRALAADADLVVMLGASITHYTVDGGRMFPKAVIAQVDLAPLGYNNGLRAGDMHLHGDVEATCRALIDAMAQRPAASSIRSAEVARRIREEPDDTRHFDVEPGTLDPRAVIAALDQTVPADFITVEGAGHSSFWPCVMRGRSAYRHIALKAFGAIGNALCFAGGAAAAARDGRVLVIDGDGGAIMHIQEMETLRREGLKLLLVVMNDGGYGAEIHKMRKEGISESGANFGRPDFAAIARGFGLAGVTVNDLAELPRLMEQYLDSDLPTVWNMPISDQVVSPRMASNLVRGHGKP